MKGEALSVAVDHALTAAGKLARGISFSPT
jgi:hypothetical protein